jgi:hypothetical protein
VAQFLSGVGRPIVWSIPSNRFAVIGSASGTVVVAAVRLAEGRPLTVGNLLGTFVALFLAWAVGREIDPDENLSAALGLVLAILTILEFGFASVWLVGGVLLAVRLVVGTVGVSLHTGDAIVIAALAGYVGYRHMSWFVVIILVVGVGVSGGAKLLWHGLLVVVGGAVGLALSHASAGFMRPTGGSLAALVGVVAAGVILSGGSPPESVTDHGGKPILRYRLVAGRIAAVIAVVVATGQAGVLATTGPVAAALLAAAGVRLLRSIQREFAKG